MENIEQVNFCDLEKLAMDRGVITAYVKMAKNLISKSLLTKVA